MRFWSPEFREVNKKSLHLLFIPRNIANKTVLNTKLLNTQIAPYLSQLSLEEYIGAHAPEKIVALSDNGYDD